MVIYKRFLSVLLVMIGLVIALPAAHAEEGRATEAALVFSSIAQPDDKSFVTAVTKGAKKAAEEYNINLSIHIQEEGIGDYDFLERVVHEKPDVVIAVSFINVEPMLDIAENYEDVKFMIVDSVVPPFFTNAKSIIFREHEGSFLVGMIAALKSETGKIGFIGGRDIPLIRNFAYGYRQGAEYVNPQIQIEEVMLGDTVQAWEEQEKAESIAEKQYAGGVDVIFAAAGASGLGVLKAAAEQGKYAIGVDSNQNALYPGSVLTSMVKKVDVAVYEALREVHEGRWDPGILNLGLKEKAIDYAVDTHNRELMDEATISVVESARDQIVRGSLTVDIYSPE